MMRRPDRKESTIESMSQARHDPSPGMADVRALARRAGPVVSLLIPVTAAVPEVSQNRVRHAHVVSQALARWRTLRAGEADGASDSVDSADAADADETAIDEASAALERLAAGCDAPPSRVATRAAFWSADQGVRVFGLPFRLAETVRVADCALIRPLALAARRPGRYRVLTLSSRRVALYEGDEDALERVEAMALPASLEATLGSDLTEPARQAHASGRAGKSIFHGQGGASGARKLDLERFHRVVARGLEEEIGVDRLPLVLASDARHRPGLERALHRDVGLLPKQLEGNADHLSEPALQAATWPIVADAVEFLPPVNGRGRGPMHHLSDIVSYAVMGRIRRLWVPEYGAIPASLDRSLARAVEAWGDDDLIELLCAEVLRHQGAVEVLEGETFSTKTTGLEAELR